MSLLSPTNHNMNPLQGFKNKIINGNFIVWQRGDTQTSNGYGSDDRWTNAHVGSTKTVTREAFTIGQTDVPNNPKYFSRTVVTSVANVNNYVAKAQRIEDVTLLSGKTVTLSFWAKADASKNIATEFYQDFGTGGTPSADITSIAITTHALTTTWKKFTVTTTLPSVSGKTLGTDGNHYNQINFWFEAGSNHNARTNSLGLQSGTFDISQVQIEVGSSATDFENRPEAIERILCYRYYEQTYGQTVAAGTITTTGCRSWQSCSTRAIKGGTGRQWVVFKRAVPTVTIYSTATGASGYIYDSNAAADLAVSVTDNTPFGYRYLGGSAPTDTNNYLWQETVDAEL